jgi:WD40 repeat protein
MRSIRGFELREHIGEGGYGVVYRAYQPAVNRQVAIKVILPKYANQPAFIRRFEAEAQLVARLEHPHIVPLYDYWREPDGAYLVMRWLRGGNLRTALEQAPWSAEAAARLLDQVAGALSAAHRQRVVHRDIKPENILLDSIGLVAEDSNAYLSDFGIAKDLLRPLGETEEGTVLGSPAYVSPEHAQGQPLSAQSDLYSLGVVMYEVLTGEHPYPGTTPADQLVKHITEPLPPLWEQRPDLPRILDGVLQRATAKDPAGRYPDALTFAAAFRAALRAKTEEDFATAVISVASQEMVNPYKGLRPFEEADAADFFGREALTEQLLACLTPSLEGGGRGRREPSAAGKFLAVVGPSGSGKSSVVKAGLLPALRAGALPDSERWFVVEMLPGAHPLDELEIGLLRVAVRQPPSLMEHLVRDERGLLRAARLILPENADHGRGELLLVIDQFEEVFTRAVNAEEREHLLQNLYAAVTEPRSPVRVVITLRADFYDRPLMHPDVGRLMREHTEVVLPLSAEELADAIRKPAEQAGAELEAGLVTAMVADVAEQPGALPMLQYALTELFERREERTLTRQAYAEIGGVSGALARRAEEVYAGLGETAQATARQIFLRLVTLGEGVEDTRRRVLRAELESITVDATRNTDTSHSSTIAEVLAVYGQSRLLTFDRDPTTRAPTVEVAHEALLREWGRLRGWLDESRADVRMQRLLASAAGEWLEAGRDASFLLRGARLDQFEGWARETDLALTQDERAYLDASLEDRWQREAEEKARQQREAALEQRARRVLQGLVGVLLAAVIVSGGLAIYAFIQRQSALRQASIGLASQALLELEGDSPERSVLLALEALENYPYTWQAERALGQAVLGNKLRLILQHEAAVNSAWWSSDATRILTASDDGMAKVWDANTGEELLTLSGHEASVRSAVWSPSGEQILTSGGDGTARVWEAATGVELLALLGHTDTVGTAVWSPTGELIVTADWGGMVRVWDVPTALALSEAEGLNTGASSVKSLYILSGHTDAVVSAAWSPDGVRLVTASDDGTAKVWDMITGEELFTLSGHTDRVKWAVWSPDGARIVTASSDGTARVWDASSGTETLGFASPGEDQLSWTSKTGAICRAAWSPAGDRIVTGGGFGDSIIRVWDVSTSSPTYGEKLFTFIGHADQILHLAWSADGSRIVSASQDGTVKIWDLTTGGELLTLLGHTGAVKQVAWSPVDDHILTVSYDGTAKIWDPDPSLLTLANLEDIHGCLIQSHTDNRNIAGFEDGTAKIWDAVTGEELVVFVGPKRNVCSQGWSPSGDRILTSNYGPIDTNGMPEVRARVWDATSGQELVALVGHSGGVFNSSWSPDGTRIVTAGAVDGTARIWDAATGEELFTFTGHSAGVTYAMWSPDGETIASGSYDGSIKIWDAATGQVIRDLYPESHKTGVLGPRWSPDGERLAAYSLDGIGSIWDATTGEELVQFTGHTGDVWALAWSRTGERLFTAGMDGTARMWDTATGVEFLRYDFGGWAEVQWLYDNTRIVVHIIPGTIKVFPAWQTLQELIDYARECCVVRELTDAERELLGLPLQ